MTKQIELHNGKVFGVEVSEHGVENGYLDYNTLAKMVGDAVMNNNVISYTGVEAWELVNGFDVEEEVFYDIYQYYIITYRGANVLKAYTDEIVYYHEELDMYVWGVTHYGTAWEYVLTDIKLV